MHVSAGYHTKAAWESIGVATEIGKNAFLPPDPPDTRRIRTRHAACSERSHVCWGVTRHKAFRIRYPQNDVVSQASRKTRILVQEGEDSGRISERSSKCKSNVIRESGVRRKIYQGPTTACWFTVIAKERVWVLYERERTKKTKRAQLQANGGLACFTMNTK